MDAALPTSASNASSLAAAGERTGGRARVGVAVAVGWTLVGLLAASQIGLGRLYEGQQVNWPRLILGTLADWYTCAVFTPPIMWMVRRWPPERLGWWRSAAAYSIPLAAMVVAKYSVYLPLRRMIWGGEARTLGAQLVNGFFFEYLALASVLGMVLALHYYRTVRARERQAAEMETLLARARLHALTGQLRPHFLFNALHGVSTLMHRDVDAADEMLSELSALLRSTLDREGVQEVPLHQELETVRHYVQIMRVRFGDRLTVTEEVDARARHALVPPLVLQPLVENAVEHGIARDRGTGRIWIRASAENGSCTITVADDGPGPAGGSDAAVREGIGLSNTRSRLAHLYGGRASLHLRARDGRGTEVVLHIPCSPALP